MNNGGDNNPWSGAFTKVGLGIMMVGISKKNGNMIIHCLKTITLDFY
jgi:hypothetical protein